MEHVGETRYRRLANVNAARRLADASGRPSRPVSMSPSRETRVTPRAAARSSSAHQNSGSRAKDVECPDRITDRFCNRLTAHAGVELENEAPWLIDGDQLGLAAPQKR